MAEPEVIEKCVDQEELAELALRLGNTYSPAGHEQPMAEAVHAWLEQNCLTTRKQTLLPDRSNVLAVLKGTGGGASLILNSHLDTEVSGPEYDWGQMQADVNKSGAYREGDRLYGHTVLNDRGLMAATMIALKALRDSKLVLKGDVIFTGVVGETGGAPVDEFQGLSYDGKGLGSQFLVSHDIRADYALVAETTEYAISWVGCGACYYKISVPGDKIYTPRSPRPSDTRQHPNAIVKMVRVIERIEKWATAYEHSHSYDSACGRVAPKVNIGAIRGGIPYRPNATCPHCAIYVDVRTKPDGDPLLVQRELEAVVASAEVNARVELFLNRPGSEAKGIEPLANEVRRCYKELFGEDPPHQAPSPIVSMWRDINVFNAAGIPSLTFGPPRRKEPGQGRDYLNILDLRNTAIIYAQVAFAICNQFR